jgi:hypothetical protein
MEAVMSVHLRLPTDQPVPDLPRAASLYIAEMPSGKVVPARFGAFAVAAPSFPGSLTVQGPYTVKDGAACLPAGTESVVFKFEKPLADDVWYLRVNYETSGSASLATSVVTPSGPQTGIYTGPVSLPQDQHRVIATLDPAAINGMVLAFTSSTGVCLDSAAVGLPAPA